MRSFLVFGSLICLLLSACGTRGPLTLPPKSAAAQLPTAVDHSKVGAPS